MAKKGKKRGGHGLLLAGGVLVVLALGFTVVMLLPTAKDKKYMVPSEPVVSSSVQTSLASLRGKVVILDFWATWCGPCRMEIPSFVSLEDKYKKQGLEIVGVSLDPITPGGRPEAVGDFMKSNKINYTIWLVNSSEATMGFDFTRGIPTTYLIDRTGKIVNRYVGVHPEVAFEADLKRVL